MPAVGETAPDFELLNQDEKPVRLSDYRGKRIVLFTFSRAGTMGCTHQACSLRDALPNIDANHDTVVLAMSDDQPEALSSTLHISMNGVSDRSRSVQHHRLGFLVS